MAEIPELKAAEIRAAITNASFAIHVPYGMWSTRLLDDRTQEQKDYDEAMAEVNAIAPGWPLP